MQCDHVDVAPPQRGVELLACKGRVIVARKRAPGSFAVWVLELLEPRRLRVPSIRASTRLYISSSSSTLASTTHRPRSSARRPARSTTPRSPGIVAVAATRTSRSPSAVLVLTTQCLSHRPHHAHLRARMLPSCAVYCARPPLDKVRSDP
jgi:hypothetical protein